MIDLKELRKEKGVTQDAVAAYLGVSRQAYSNYEKGKRLPDHHMLKKLASYFGVSVDVLLGVEESMPERDVTDDDIQYALFGGKVSDAAYEDVKRYARFIKEQYENGSE